MAFCVQNGHKGSEHRLDGEQYAGELHFVHHHNNFDNLTHALQSGKHDALAVVGVFIKRSSEEPKGFELVRYFLPYHGLKSWGGGGVGRRGRG